MEANNTEKFVPQEVAYLIQNMRGTAQWKRTVCRTAAAFERKMAELSDKGAEVMVRDLEGAL